jgi:asparagine N-glycosylation enzyme membrane subunit Stt3
MTSISHHDPRTDQMTSTESQPAGKPSFLRVLRDQRKTSLVALALMVASFWIAGQLGEWRLAGCIAGGVFLGLVNHLVTEYWLLKTISSGATPTRNQMIVSTVMRLAVLTVVAVGFAVIFWPDGIGLLLGLAIFRLIALVMTTLPLLKELKNP